MFKISIIIPCYNVSDYIDRCLTSIINQTIGADCLQIICIDDASTDDTWQHLQKWEQQYSDNFVLIPLTANSRQGTCRNIAMEYVSAPWVTFIDSDDWVEPDYCEIMYAYANDLDCDIVRCSVKRDSSEGLSYFQNREANISDQYILIDTIAKRKKFICSRTLGESAWGKLVSTSFLKEHNPFFAENIAYEEVPWHTLLHIYSSKIYIVSKYLYHYFENPTSTTSNRNTLSYTDIITSCLLAWKTWAEHDLLSDYRNELEYTFVFYGYLVFLKNIMLSAAPSYSFYLLAREVILEHVPDYASNPYLTCFEDPTIQLLINSLGQPLDRSQFGQIISRTAL